MSGARSGALDVISNWVGRRTTCRAINAGSQEIRDGHVSLAPAPP